MTFGRKEEATPPPSSGAQKKKSTTTAALFSSMKQVVCKGCFRRFSLFDDYSLACPRCSRVNEQQLIVKREEVIDFMKHIIVGEEVVVDTIFLEALKLIQQGITQVVAVDDADDDTDDFGDNDDDDDYNDDDDSKAPQQKKDHDTDDDRAATSPLEQIPKPKSSVDQVLVTPMKEVAGGEPKVFLAATTPKNLSSNFPDATSSPIPFAAPAAASASSSNATPALLAPTNGGNDIDKTEEAAQELPAPAPQKDHHDTPDDCATPSCCSPLEENPEQQSADVLLVTPTKEVAGSSTTTSSTNEHRQESRGIQTTPSASHPSSSSSTKKRKSASWWSPEERQKAREEFGKALVDLPNKIGDKAFLPSNKNVSTDPLVCGVPNCSSAFAASGAGSSMWILARTNRSGNELSVPVHHPLHTICLTCLPRASPPDQPVLINPREFLSEAIMAEIPRCEEHTYAVGTTEDLIEASEGTIYDEPKK